MIRYLCSVLAKLMGWKYVAKYPENIGNCVIIGAPHTSNWDFIPAMALLHQAGINAKYVIKSEWMFFPLGLFFKASGALGLDRKKIGRGEAESTTDLMAQLYNGQNDLCLVISPEGTRSPNEKWKTGFYYIAKKAGVPIIMAYADWRTKTIGYSQPINTNDFETDMKKICDFYSDKHGKNDENFKLDKRYR